MGKGILITVLGLSIIVIILIINLNANTISGLDSTVDFYDKTQVRLIANSGIETYLEKLRRNKSLMGNFYNNQALGGKYDVYISGVDTLLKVKAIAEFSGIKHTSFATACRKKVDLPNVNSAMYISTTNLQPLLNGNCDINGNDHNIDGSSGPSPSKPGIGVDTPNDSAYVINELKPKVSQVIQGSGGAPSVSVVDDKTDWLALTENAIFSADITLSSGNYSTGTDLGTISSPKIIYANGDIGFTNCSGAGILIINGDVKLSGNFKFYGIVLVYGQSTIEANFIGNNGIYGGTILVGDQVDIKAAGNSSFYYSSEAINKAQMNLKSSRFEILSWWE